VVAEIGRFVEVDPSERPQWFVAGAWDGTFARGDFHTAEHFFGSGLRIEGADVVVAPAHSTVDRCVYARDAEVWHVSNSLVLLLGRLGARIDPSRDHRQWGESMALGVYNYFRQFSVVHPRFSNMSQLIFEKLVIDANGRPSFRFTDVVREFKNYDDYVGQLGGAVKRLWSNASDSARQRPMRAVSSASRGYDSGTVLALAVEAAGPKMLSWSAPRSNTRIPAPIQKALLRTNLSDDDGSEIAEKLGAAPKYLDLNLRHIEPELEAWCWATAQISPELVFHALLSDAAQFDVPTFFFAGHFGDGVWERELPEIMRTGQIIRGAQSGYALIEARNRFGVVEGSIPYMFGRSVASVHRISTSDEMKPWQLTGDYDRPICRRVLETRGVRREAFGFGKKAVAQDVESPQGEGLRELFFSRSAWSPLTESIYRGVNLGLYFVRRTSSYVSTGSKIIWSGDAKRTLASVADLQRQTFVVTTSWLADTFAP
jgi:hypothetical protein